MPIPIPKNALILLILNYPIATYNLHINTAKLPPHFFKGTTSLKKRGLTEFQHLFNWVTEFQHRNHTQIHPET